MMTEKFDLTPTDGSLGAIIHNLDLSQPLEPDLIAQLKTAFAQYSVLVFRGQALSERDQLRFSRKFGDSVRHPVSTQAPGPVEEITVISNVEEDGKPIGALGNQDLAFHADLVFLPKPGSISTLYALEVPRQGGDTIWASGYAAYEALDETEQARFEGVRIRYTHARPEYNPPEPASHPLICTHPDTRRKTFYFSPNHATAVLGYTPEESRDALDFLIGHITHPRFCWQHQWQAGDLVMWDNRCTIHGRTGFDNRERRIMKRTQALGYPDYQEGA